MERLQQEAEEHHVTLNLTDIFSDTELDFQQIDSLDIPDHVLSDILDATVSDEPQKRIKWQYQAQCMEQLK